ncbi:MAG: FeoA family protein, partial [Anaerolineae bacterium]
ETTGGDQVRIRRVHELAEHNAELMTFLEKNGIVPDTEATVAEVVPANQTVRLAVHGGDVVLGFAAARYVYVER